MTVIVATVTAYEDDDLEFAFQDMMEKRGRGKGGRGKGPEFMRKLTMCFTSSMKEQLVVES